MFRIERITGTAAPVYERMTYAEQRKLLRDLDDWSEGIALALMANDRPIGLGLARGHAGEEAEIVSLFVVPDFWNRGLGTALLQALEQALVNRGCSSVRLSYSTQGKTTGSVQRLLAKCDWSPPAPQMSLIELSPSAMKNELWIAHTSVPAGFTVFPWEAISARDRETLENARPQIPSALWPLQEDSIPVEPLTSIGLRHQDEIVGWMLTHRVSPRVVRYTSLYVREPWQRATVSFGLLAEAARRHLEHFGKEVAGSLAVRMENLPMRRVVERRFRPHATSYYELWQSRKGLTREAQALK